MARRQRQRRRTYAQIIADQVDREDRRKLRFGAWVLRTHPDWVNANPGWALETAAHLRDVAKNVYPIRSAENELKLANEVERRAGPKVVGVRA